MISTILIQAQTVEYISFTEFASRVLSGEFLRVEFLIATTALYFLAKLIFRGITRGFTQPVETQIITRGKSDEQPSHSAGQGKEPVLQEDGEQVH